MLLDTGILTSKKGYNSHQLETEVASERYKEQINNYNQSNIWGSFMVEPNSPVHFNMVQFKKGY